MKPSATRSRFCSKVADSSNSVIASVQEEAISDHPRPRLRYRQQQLRLHVTARHRSASKRRRSSIFNGNGHLHIGSDRDDAG
ncbi:hypothetical protein ACLOJK_041253 [Asimina triloba]